jgi:hypothetical protein
MRIPTELRYLASFIPLLLVASCGTDEAPADIPPSPDSEPSPYLYIWAGDSDAKEGDTDFLAVVDANPLSTTYGTVLGTAPVGSVGNNPHHAEMVAPSDGLLFANGFRANRSFLFDLSSPASPVFARQLDPVPGYNFLHSFLRLQNGHVLATAQLGDGSRPGDVGGLAEFDANGGLLRTSSASDPDWEGKSIRPYSMEVSPEADRILSTSFAMSLERSENLVQLWRLSDLSLLQSVPLPQLDPAEEPACYFEELVRGTDCSAAQVPGHDRPFEIRMLADGSAILNTLACAFYRIHDLESDELKVELLMNWADVAGCGVPTRVGKFLIVPMMLADRIVTLDVSDPTRPVEVARLAVASGTRPHWSQVDPGTHRIVVTGSTSEGSTVHIYMVNPETGELTRDEAFGPGFTMDREEWPHGPTGPASPHAALFGR